MAHITAVHETDIVDAVRAAREAATPLEIIGRGTKRGFGRPLAAMNVLDVSGVSGIVSYEAEELVLTARAATPIAEIVAALDERGQQLGFDPVAWGSLLGTPGEATLGGVVSADCCGSHKLRYGAVRDHVLGFRGVNGFGEAFRAGGKVVKNVTGFDIAKLVCGAMGTLCVLSEITVRVVPKPEKSITLAVDDIAPRDGFALLRKIWSSPVEASGLAYVPDGARVLIRVDGAPQSLEEKCAAVRAIASAHDLKEWDDGDALFANLGSGAAFVQTAHDVWRVMLPPAAAADFAGNISSSLWWGDWAGGVLWIGLKKDDIAAAQNLRSLAAASGGYAILLRADAQMRARVGAFAPEPPPRAALTRSVTAAFDPLGMFNPGRMYEAV